MVNYACAFSQSESGKYFEWIIIVVICLPTEHLGVFKNSLERVREFQIELEFGNVGF